MCIYTEVNYKEPLDIEASVGDRSVHMSSQWETTLHCNVVWHWPGHTPNYPWIIRIDNWWQPQSGQFKMKIFVNLTCPLNIWRYWLLGHRSTEMSLIISLHIRILVHALSHRVSREYGDVCGVSSRRSGWNTYRSRAHASLWGFWVLRRGILRGYK